MNLRNYILSLIIKVNITININYTININTESWVAQWSANSLPKPGYLSLNPSRYRLLTSQTLGSPNPNG